MPDNKSTKIKCKNTDIIDLTADLFLKLYNTEDTRRLENNNGNILYPIVISHSSQKETD